MARQECDYYGREIYSTSEQVVGTWVDGKPIYQKTFTYTLPSTVNDGQTDYTIGSIASANIDSLINFSGCVRGNQYMMVPVGPYHSPSAAGMDFMLLTNMNTGDVLCRLNMSSGYGSRVANGKVCAVMEYTKTTN